MADDVKVFLLVLVLFIDWFEIFWQSMFCCFPVLLKEKLLRTKRANSSCQLNIYDKKFLYILDFFLCYFLSFKGGKSVV